MLVHLLNLCSEAAALSRTRAGSGDRQAAHPLRAYPKLAEALAKAERDGVLAAERRTVTARSSARHQAVGARHVAGTSER